MNRAAVFWGLLILLLLLLAGGTLVLWPGGAGFMPWAGRGMPGYGPGGAPQAVPQGMPGYPGAAYGWGGLDTLNLNDAQMARIDGVLRDLTGRERSLGLQAMEAREELWRQQANVGRNPRALDEAYDRLAKLQRQAYEAREEAMGRIASVLTPEQRSRWQGGGSG
jgi:Spy/CpxP family protein refolding chaperone